MDLPNGSIASEPTWSSRDALQEYWPRRLLHIPTLTSFDRDEQDCYDHVLKPKYNILTYTWGRWEQPEGVRLHVHGVSWQIPAVRPEHFTVAQFQAVLEEMGKTSPWAWVDIACIDQKNTAVKMDEVGRQAAIFANAYEVFVWLNHHEAESLNDVFETFRDKHDSNGKPRPLADLIDPRPDAIARRIDRTLLALQKLTQDPWFSSLWTLQEFILRKDAIILDKWGRAVKDDRKIQLSCLFGAFSLMGLSRNSSLSRRYEKNASVWNSTNALTLRTLIHKSGIAPKDAVNPNIQYSAAKYRKTTNPEDQIYAIMQVYGFRLGTAADPDRRPSLHELEDEFISTLTKDSVCLSQMFIHTVEPPAGESWRLTQDSTVPYELAHVSSGRNCCSINVLKAQPRRASFQGPMCTFATMIELWDALKKPNGPLPGRLDMFLDPSERHDHVTGQSVGRDGDKDTSSNARSHTSGYYAPTDVGRHLLAVYEDVRVLKVGTDLNAGLERTVQRPVTAEGSQSSSRLSDQLGMLVVRPLHRASDTWRRMGVVVWRLSGSDEIDFTETQGIFG